MDLTKPLKAKANPPSVGEGTESKRGDKTAGENSTEKRREKKLKLGK